MSIEKVKKEKRKMNLVEALVVFAIVVVLIGYSAISGAFPIAVGILLSLVVAMIYGIGVLHFSFDDLFDSSTKTVASVFYGLMFALSVGFVSAAWLSSGTIQFLLYWGLKLINPNMFLLIAFVTCAVAAFATGQAWTMVPTLGLAYIGIAEAQGIALPLAAAAIVSGCFIGDAASPLSEVPAIATSCAGSKDTIGTIKSMLPTLGIGIVVGIVFFFVMGLGIEGGAGGFAEAEGLIAALESGFNLSPLTLLPLVVVFILVFMKASPLVAVIVGALVGVVQAALLQGITLTTALTMTWSGYVSATGNEQIDLLLTRGGIMDFSGTIMMLLIAFSFAGVANHIGMLEAIVNGLLKFVKKRGSLVVVTTVTTLLAVMLTCSANVASVLTGAIYKDAYKKMDMAPINLGREMSMNGSVFNAMLPWSASGALCFSVLGVVPFQYWIYMVPFWVALVLNIVWAYLGIFTPKASEAKVEAAE